MAIAARKDAPKTEAVSNVDPKTGTDPKTETKAEVKTEPKILTPTAPTEESKEQKEVWTADQKKFVDMTQDQLWANFGGRDKRGVVSQAIRYLNALGFTKSKIADLTGKRYQHVRNVLVEDARMAAAKK